MFRAIVLAFALLSTPAHSEKLKIANVKAKLTTGFYVGTTTNVPSRVIVKYGLNQNLTTGQAADNVFKTSHRVDIDGLNFGTKYFYQIIAIDKSGKQAKTKTLFYITEKK